MTGRRAVFGLCMLSALMFSAVAAQGASATVKGTTAFTCKEKVPSGGAGFSKEHCKPEDAVSTGAKFEHVAIAENTTTEITGTNEKTNAETNEPTVARLRSTISGTAVELSAKVVHGEGWAENSKTETGEHYVHGTGTITFTEVEVTKPAGKGCEVYTDNNGVEGEKGVVHTEPLVATTDGQEHSLTFEPDAAAGATAFAHFIIKGCSISALNTTYTVTGKVTGVPNGATTNFNEEEITTKESLFLNERKAGIEGSLTIKGRDPKITGDTTKPLSVTTVET